VFHMHVVSVSGVSYACCRCFIWLLQVFYLNVVKVYQGDVACVAMDINVCCKCMCSRVLAIPDGCCNYFI
jgi:hypothetical protein